MKSQEDSSLRLLEPVAQQRLGQWLAEFYGHPVQISKRQVLRHRDLSYVERIFISHSFPLSIIYKLVLPPWDIEKDILERVLIPSISNSPRLYLAAHSGPLTALFLEDLGEKSILQYGNSKLASKLGQELAKMHRSYVYRIDELMQSKIIRSITPIDYLVLAAKICKQLMDWHLIRKEESKDLQSLFSAIARQLAREPISLVHGDCYAENIILYKTKLCLIDWSWFTFIGVPLYDLATLTAPHKKNGEFLRFKMTVIEAYCDESARDAKEVIALLPYLEALSRLLFLDWLVERKLKGLEGTTIGPVDGVIPNVVQECISYNSRLS